MKKGIEVFIDDCKFNSIKEAADFLEMSIAKLTHMLRKEPKICVNGMTVERMNPLRFRQRFEILCTNTGEVFKSVPEMLHSYGLRSDTGNPIYQHVMKQFKEKGKIKLGTYDLELMNAPEYAETIRGEKVNDNNEYIIDEQTKSVVVDLEQQPVSNKSAIDTLTSLVRMLMDKGEYETAYNVLGVLVKNKEELSKINCA